MVREDLRDEIPWLERRGTIRCGFDRAHFRVHAVLMGGVAVGCGVFMLVRGQAWSSAVGSGAALLGLFGVVLGLIYVRTVRCVLEVDFDRSEFRLHHFVYPLGFWDIRRKPLVTVPFGEVRGVSMQSTKKRGRAAFIGTERSRFLVSEDIRHFDRIVRLATELAGPDGNAAMGRETVFRMWIPALIGGGLVCLLAWIAVGLGWI